MTDSLALERYAATQDPEAFAHLVQRYGQMVYATCLRTLGHATDAEDAAQDTFVQLATSAGSIRSNAGAWLHRTATNVSISRMRSAGRRRAREAAVAKPERVGDATQSLEWAEIRDAVDEALAAMPDESRALIVQRYLVGRTQADLAAERGVSASMMSRRVNAAVEGLRDRLKAKGVAAAAAVLTTGWAAESAVALPVALTGGLVKIGVSGVSALSAAGVSTAAVAGVSGAGAGLAEVVRVTSAAGLVGVLLIGGLFFASNNFEAGEPLAPVTTIPPPGAGLYEAPSTAQRVVVPSAVDKGLLAQGTRRVDANAQPLDGLVATAHGLPAYQVVWEIPVPAGRYDVTLNGEAWPGVLQKAVSDEFGLAFKTEPRAVDGWVVRLAADGTHRLTPAARPRGGQGSTDRGKTIVLRNCDLGGLTGHLSRALNAPVDDATGLHGGFDLELRRRRGRDAAPYVADVARATGLRVEPLRRVMDVVVVSASPVDRLP